jgi:carboxyl-terminal processing protease
VKCKRPLIFCLIYFSMTLNSFAMETNREVLEKVWALGKRHSCTPKMQQEFSDANFVKVLEQTKSSDDRVRLSASLNDFLFSLGYSHTEFFTDKTEGYYFFKSHASLNNPGAPPPPLAVNPGVQLLKSGDKFFVSEVMDGFGAQAAGLVRGDQIIELNHKAFTGTWGPEAGEAVVRLKRVGQVDIEKKIRLEKLNLAQALQQASVNSVRVIDGKIGYVHLWTGTHADSATLLQNTVNDFQSQNIKSMLLDLRGGYGGAWWDHLKPFFSNTKDFFVAETIAPNGEVTRMEPPLESNPNHFAGKMVVLINGGTRSGKEVLAHHFQQTKRAHLIGETTKGYVTVGRFFFAKDPFDYVLYLCNSRVKVDGFEIEGKGVSPDEKIPFWSDNKFQDSQILRAVEYLSGPTY